MTTLESLQTAESLKALQAGETPGREVTTELGLPSVVREGSALSRYTWTAGELTGITEPDGTQWQYGYGADGRLLEVRKNQQPWAEYGYDEAGRLTRASRPEGTLTHGYDAQGRLLRTLRGDASAFAYTWEGQRVFSARCNGEQTRFQYDEQGRLIGLDQQVEGTELSLRSIFDGEGRLARIEFPQWRQVVGFGWDGRGRPASITWNDRPVSLFGSDDATRLSWREGANGVREETWHEGARPLQQVLSRAGQEFWRCDLVRDEAFRLVREGNRTYGYDLSGRLAEAHDEARHWRFQQDDLDQPVLQDAQLERDAGGRLHYARRGATERIFRHNEAGELQETLVNGNRAARCRYDHKGRLVLKEGSDGTERYLYGADDALLAIADGEGQPRIIFLRLPIGLVGLIDFRQGPEGRVHWLHCDAHGNLVFTSSADGTLEGPFDSDPYGAPLRVPGSIPYVYHGRLWHQELGLYRMGCRWYDPALRQFLTPDSHTGAPDDERLVNPFRRAGEQRMARVQILGHWLREPRLRNRFAYCINDPVNRFDPDGHWSFGGVLLSLLGVLWTLPNTAFGLAVEVSCLLGEVVRWLVWIFSGGHASWQTPGFDVASSGNLNAFALVFKGGWLGSFESLLGITFGNVIFINGEYQNHPAWQALPDPVTPPAYGGAHSGELTLAQTGASVTGTWDGDKPLTGTLNGSTLTGSWQPATGSGGGQFILTFAADGKSFSGTFGTGTAAAPNPWTGSLRVDAAHPPVAGVVTGNYGCNWTGSTITVPKSQALYEHELRHVNQYGWWGPFFHLGLPIFGVYEWDCILNGYQNAGFETDARDHGGF